VPAWLVVSEVAAGGEPGRYLRCVTRSGMPVERPGSDETSQNSNAFYWTNEVANFLLVDRACIVTSQAITLWYNS
jgi:hypothetical protein